MGVSFNLVVAPRPYTGFYRPAHPVFFAASPVFFRPAPLIDTRTALGITAAAVGVGALSQAFNNHAHPPLTNYGNRMYLQPPGGRLATQQSAPPQAQQGAPPQAQSTPAKPPEPPKVATPLADALDGAKGLKRDSNDPKAITALQKFLQKAGYGEKLGKTGTSNDGVDGVFGNRTGSALEQFQIDNHLPRTGILDEATVKMMHEVEQKMATPKPEEAAPQRVAMARSKPSSPGMG
jgi:hypothetical protein